MGKIRLIDPSALEHSRQLMKCLARARTWDGTQDLLIELGSIDCSSALFDGTVAWLRKVINVHK